MAEDWSRIFSRVRQKTVTRAIINFNKTKKQASFITTNLSDYVVEETTRWTDRAEPTSRIDVHFEFPQVSATDTWRGHVGVTRSIKGLSHTATSAGGFAILFDFPKTTRLPLILKTAVEQVAFSKTAIEYFVPIALAYSALLVLAYRLSRSLY